MSDPRKNLAQHVADLIEAQIYPAYLWECSREECDGTPHEGNDYAHARTKQRLPKGDWFIWLLLCGRGFGKTRTGSETFLDLVLSTPKDVAGRPTEWLVAGATHEETRDLMWEGVSGLKHSLARRGVAYTYNKNEKWITLTATGQRIKLDNAEDEDFGRGGEWSGVWVDEFGKFRRIKIAWTEALIPSVRAQLPNGKRPRILITTTPKIRQRDAFQILAGLTARTDGSAIVTMGTTWENEHNLSPDSVAEWRNQYPEGSRAYRQEFLAELTDEVEGALWFQANIDETRVKEAPATLPRVVVAVDPAASNGPESDDTGIMVAGCAGSVRDRQYFVLSDRTSHGTPDEWGRAAVAAWAANSADRIVYESNQGGAMAAAVLKTAARDMLTKGEIKTMPVITAVRATRGKAVRAEPIAALYAQQRVHHVGPFPDLEEQLTTWTPESKDSPDRLDALVWALTALSTTGSGGAAAF